MTGIARQAGLPPIGLSFGFLTVQYLFFVKSTIKIKILDFFHHQLTRVFSTTDKNRFVEFDKVYQLTPPVSEIFFACRGYQKIQHRIHFYLVSYPFTGSFKNVANPAISLVENNVIPFLIGPSPGQRNPTLPIPPYREWPWLTGRDR